MLEFHEYQLGMHSDGSGWSLCAVARPYDVRTQQPTMFAMAECDIYQKRTQVRIEFYDGSVVWCRSSYWAKHLIAERYEDAPADLTVI